MADQSADFTKKVLVDIEIKSEQVKKELPAILTEIQNLTDAQKVLEVQGQKNTKQWIENASTLRLLKSEVREHNKYIDNTAKALNAENNSIAQNRALLSLLTSEHIKLGQANGNTKSQVEASAKSINDLTKVLKEQEKAIGQTYRNVGNYADAIREVAGELGNAIPGFQQFSNVIGIATKVGGFLPSALASIGSAAKKAGNEITSFVGFKQFNTQAQETTDTVSTATEAVTALAGGEAAAGTAAEGAAGGFSVMGAAVTLATGAIAAIIGAIAGAIAYMKRLDSVADETEQVWEGLKAGFYAGAESIKSGDWKGLVQNMALARAEGAALTEQMQDLGDAMESQAVHSASAENQISDLMLKMRNKRTTPEQEQKYFDDIQKISTADYERRKKNADNLYQIEILNAVNGKKISKEEIDRLRKGGTDVAIQLENENKIWSGSYKKIAEAQKQRLAADQFYQSVRDRSQNRLDAQQLAQNAKDEAARNKAEQDARRAEQLRQKEAEAFTETQNMRKASISREMALIYEEYGDRVIAADTAYNNEISKLQKFLDRKLITQKQFNSVAAQETKEHEAVMAKIIDDFKKSDEAKYIAANNELANLNIAGIQNETDRTVKALQQRSTEAMQAIDKYNEDRIEAIKALDIEVNSLEGAQQAEAMERRDNERVLLQVSENKRAAIIKQTEQDIARIRRNALDQQNKLRDTNDVNEAVTKFGGNSSQALAARQAQLLDNYNAEVSNEALTAAAKLEIERKYLMDKDALDKQAHLANFNFQMDAAAQIGAGILDILSQNADQASQIKLNQISKAKDAELENTSLTNTQRKLIEAKYAKLEKQEKEKAFKQNQKLQVANVLINGAVGISKTIAEMGFLPAIPFIALTAASTALSVSKILGQKPAFATGGVFESDGRGAVLPGYSKHDNINAKLRSGEGVIVSEAMRNPWARNTVSHINEMFGGRSFAIGGAASVMPAFATGGIYTDGGSANRYYSQPVYDSEGLANSLAYQLINNMPPIIVDVKDVNNQQGILATTQNRVIL